VITPSWRRGRPTNLPLNLSRLPSSNANEFGLVGLHDDARNRPNDEVAPAGRIEADGLTRQFGDTTMLNSTYGWGSARGLELRLRSAVANTGGLSVSDGRQEQAFTPDSRFCLLNAVQHSPRHPLHACERRRATGCGGELY